jgi:hypothetical protein
MHRHIGLAAIVAAIVGTTLLLTSTALAAKPLFRDAMYYVVPFTVAVVTRWHALKGVNGEARIDSAVDATAGAAASAHGDADPIGDRAYRV